MFGRFADHLGGGISLLGAGAIPIAGRATISGDLVESAGTATTFRETPAEGATTDTPAETPLEPTTQMPTETPSETLTLECLDDAVEPDPDEQSSAQFLVESYHDVESIWPGAPTDYALLTRGEMQFVAIYDAVLDEEGEYVRDAGRLTVGQRHVDCGSAWEFSHFDSWLAWDDHNYITMAVDSTDRLHVTGNMHSTPLQYFRTREPMDITTLERIDEMVGADEARVTYPQFIRDPQGRLVFEYRSGESGEGVRMYNVYDPETRSWSRLLDDPLLDGSAADMNAYPVGPELGPDGYYHLVWVWRDTSDAVTNHDLSYARTEDLVDWETSGGRPLELPVTYDEAEIVDPVPVHGGVINNNTQIGFDSRDRVILSYHKFGDDGNTQIYNARREADGWQMYRTSDWNYRWEFGGGGTIEFEVSLSGVSVDRDGRLVQSYDHAEYGSGTWVLNESNLRPTGKLDRPPEYPERASVFEANDDRLQLNWVQDLGVNSDTDNHYALRWPTLPVNRDQAWDDVPDPTSLRLYKFRENPDVEADVTEI